MPNVMAALPDHIMCGNMVDVQSATAENRQEKKSKNDSNHSGKIECPHLLRRAAINSN